MTVTDQPAAASATRRLTTAKAISEAIAQEMERDPEVFVMGEDVGAYGGIFGATTGLLDQFGPTRVIDTPISETGFIGAGIGAAVEGMRPVVELMFVDFFGVCMDQIYNLSLIHTDAADELDGGVGGGGGGG
jgi:pyruvate dehydrogenase E1 component beta subunit